MITNKVKRQIEIIAVMDFMQGMAEAGSRKKLETVNQVIDYLEVEFAKLVKEYDTL